MRKQPHNVSSDIGAWLEGLLFFILAIVLFSSFQALPGSPNLSLIFDSQGYLAAGGACQKLFSWEFLSAVASYVASGFSEPSRLLVLNKLGAASDLGFSGPIVPFFLACVYNLFGKQAISQNWLIGANAFLVVSAAMVPLVWLAAKQFWGPGQARLAAILALTYPPLAINSWRILGDVTTCFAAALLLALLAKLTMSRSYGLPALCWGALTGTAIVWLMLGKAPLMLFPWLALAEILFLAVILRVPDVFNAHYVVGILLGCAIALAPWMLVKQIITGQPSIIVDRGGAYNFWVGCNLQADGWDILPSRFVANPKEFTKTSAEVKSEVLSTFKDKPLSFIDLMARKPARLMCAPWNDFQNSFFGIPWVMQKWWQEVILLLAFAGALISLRVAVVRRDFKEIAPIVILCTFVLYFLIYAPVISMSRYFYPAVPALLLLSSQGLFWMISQSRKVAFQLLIVATLVLPGLLAFIDPSLAVNSLWLGKQVAQHGVGNVALFGSTAIVICLSLWFWILSLATGKVAKLEPFKLVVERRGRRYLLLWSCARFGPLVVLLGALVCASASARQELFCLEWAKQLTGRKSIECKIFVPRQVSPRSWYLVVDAVGTGTDPSFERHPDLDVQVNGKQIKAEVRPFWALDCSQRDNLVYLKTFAYGQGKNIEDIRQWWCVAMPADLVRENSNNQITVSSSSESQTRPVVFGDFVTPEGEPGGHTLSLRNFSWCKGFFADCVGEMRMDSIVRPRGLTNIWFQAPKIRPRIRLLAIADRPTESSFSDISFSVPKISIGPGQALLVVDKSIPAAILSQVNRQISGLPGPSAALIQVSANYRSAKAGKTSICLVESLDDVPADVSSTQFAPLAPTVMQANSKWQTVSFEDIVPLANVRGQEPATLKQVRVLLSAVSWWDLLSYGRFKAKTNIDFEDLLVRLRAIKVFNLDAQKYEEYQSQVLN